MIYDYGCSTVRILHWRTSPCNASHIFKGGQVGTGGRSVKYLHSFSTKSCCFNIRKTCLGFRQSISDELRPQRSRAAWVIEGHHQYSILALGFGISLNLLIILWILDDKIWILWLVHWETLFFTLFLDYLLMRFFFSQSAELPSIFPTPSLLANNWAFWGCPFMIPSPIISFWPRVVDNLHEE